MTGLVDDVDVVKEAVAGEGRPLWMGLASRADRWAAVLGASGYLTRAIKFGVRDMPSVPFTKGEILPQSPRRTRTASLLRRIFPTECELVCMRK